jgi:hypothetical protein
MQGKSQRDLGIAGVVAAILVIKGAGMAFAAGILLCALLYGKDFFKGENDKILQIMEKKRRVKHHEKSSGKMANLY